MQNIQIKKDLAAKTIQITRDFNAPLNKVWRAFTEKELLDQWWGPQPWKAETKHMDFTEGGYWLYAMVGPNGEKHWSRADFLAIDPMKSFKGKDGFCDENGTMNPEMPLTDWTNVFTETAEGTRVTNTLQFQDVKDLQTLVDMGFEQGYSMGLNQLEALLNSL
jgi:uncharacterized protein YndB with AHSA1/START domain